MPASCKALMVYPRFSNNSFWNYQAACKVVGARYSATPLGLLTVAAMLPPDWDVRLIDCNTTALTPSDLEWADLVMTGGMLPQQLDTLHVIELAHRHGKPVVVGGPDVTSCPDRYETAEYRVLGEAEDILKDFLAAWRRGDPAGTFRATSFPDLTGSPVPRFDLINLSHYMHVGVQRSRGCPFNCEFCNVIELNGRVPRAKATAQILRELDTLYDLGYRGHVDFVDDNLIGNPKSVKPFLAELAVWQERKGHPFEFSSEASLNLAEDDELLDLMKRSDFFAIFVGIETPNIETLIQTGKRQNTRRSIAESIAKIHRAGIFVNAGFIIGFDNESGNVADAMVQCIEEAAIPVCMVGLLYALPNTQLSSRLLAEGRLHSGSDRPADETVVDQCTSGLNFITLRPRREILRDYQDVLLRIYEPKAYFGRVRRMARLLDLSLHQTRPPFTQVMRDLRSFARIIWQSGVLDGEVRGPFWSAVIECLLRHPRAIRIVASQAALYLHYWPLSKFMDQRLQSQILACPLAAMPARSLATMLAPTPRADAVPS
jgi:radical SAM superfamily enzyme YgiQ (UPF0313 family)